MPADPQKARELFLHAVGKLPPEEWDGYVAEACGGDAELLRHVGRLLDVHREAGSFLNVPAVVQIAAGLPQPDDATAAMESNAEGAAIVAPREDRPDQAVTQDEGQGDHEEIALSFLQPSTKPGSLGRLGHYEVLEVVGRGGMGIVLRAFDEKLQRVVAIKLLASGAPPNGAARQRFVREARAAAAVRDEHVVGIYAVEESAEAPYLVMEYIAGVSLQERLDRSGSLEVKEVLRIGLQAASGLAAAHAQGLIHRDVKPANILLENDVERVKITDFGLARAAADASLTQEGVVAGTPQYMAPEQARGEALDHRADLFSLGGVLYALCTGRPPFRGGNALAVLKRVCEDAPPPVREINPDVPEWLVAIIARLQAKDRAERFQSAQEVAEVLGRELAALQRGGVERPQTPRRAPPAKRSRRLLVVAAVVIALVVLGVGGYLLAPTVLRIVANQGELVIETDDPDVEVIVKQGGERVKIIDAKTQREVNLKAGSYQLELAPGKDGLSLSTNQFTLERNGLQIVKVRLEPTIAARPPAADLFKDAVLHMTFEKDTFYEKDGKTYVRDLSGRGNDGLCDNVAFTPDGKAGGGLLCQGGQLQLAKSLINRQPNYTITAWCRCEKPGPADAHQHLYLTATPGQLNQSCFDAYFPPERTCYVNAWNADLPPENWLGVNAGGSTVPAGWFFVAIALTDGETGKGKLRIVIDDRIHARTSQMVATDGQPQPVDVVGYNMNGVIDELAVFQRALSDEEIQAIRQRGIGGRLQAKTPQPAGAMFQDAVLHMTFAKDTFYEKEGKTYVRDLSGNGYDGLCEGGAYLEGKARSGLKCDGKGWLRIPHSLLNHQANYTVTAWVRLRENAPDGELFKEGSSQNDDMIYDASLVPGGAFFCAAWNRSAKEYWFNCDKAGVFPYEKWVFLTTALENGGAETGSLRVTVDDKEYLLPSQMVDSPMDDVCVFVGRRLEGTLGEVAVFRRFLSAGEIEAIRQRGSDNAPPP